MKRSTALSTLLRTPLRAALGVFVFGCALLAAAIAWQIGRAHV